MYIYTYILCYVLFPFITLFLSVLALVMEGENEPAHACPSVPGSNQCATDDWWKQALDEAEVDLFGLVDGGVGTETNCSVGEKSSLSGANVVADMEISNPPSVLTNEGNALQMPSVEVASPETLDHLSPMASGVQPGESGKPRHSENDDTMLPRVNNSSPDPSGNSNFVADDYESNEGSLDSDLFLQLPIPPSFIPFSVEGEEEEENGLEREFMKKDNISCQEQEEASTNYDEEVSALGALTHVIEPFDFAAQTPACTNQFGLDEEHTPDLPDPQSPWSVKFPPQHISDSVPDHTLPGAYIEQASMLITKAVQLESQEDYHEAFDLFKAGVDLLLNGVQSMWLYVLVLIKILYIMVCVNFAFCR